MIVQFGGQTPLNLAQRLLEAGVPIIGTSPDSIDLAEDRKRFGKLLEDLDIPQPAGGTATSVEEALAGGERIGYPVLVRPSYVLGGRAMVIAYDAQAVAEYMKQAVEYSQERPVLVDHFLENAVEVDVDALCDSEDVIIAGIMQHIEEAGIHSGDSSCVLPAVEHPRRDPRHHPRTTRASWLWRSTSSASSTCSSPSSASRWTGPRLRHRGKSARLAHRPVRLQSHRHTAREDRLAPDDWSQASRATARSNWPAARISKSGSYFYVKSPVFPWSKFAGVDTVLGPEMKSTGEVMGVAENFRRSLRKSPARRRSDPAIAGNGLFQRERSRQACCNRTWHGASSISASRSSPPKAPRTHWRRPA